MFKNIGKKIKTFAKIFCGIEISLFAIIGMAIGFGVTSNYAEPKKIFLGILLGFLSFVIYLAIGVLLSWVSAFIIYGFGELVDNSTTMIFLQNETLKTQKALLENMRHSENKKWRCTKCGSEISENYTYCPFCDYVEKKEHLKKAHENSQE